MPFSSRDKAYVPGAKPKVDMPTLDKELQELVAELQPTPEERQRQQVGSVHFLTAYCILAIFILTSALHPHVVLRKLHMHPYWPRTVAAH